MDCSMPVPSTHGISSQGHWSGLPFSSPEYLPNPGIVAGFLPTEPPGKLSGVTSLSVCTFLEFLFEVK